VKLVRQLRLTLPTTSGCTPVTSAIQASIPGLGRFRANKHPTVKHTSEQYQPGWTLLARGGNSPLRASLYQPLSSAGSPSAASLRQFLQ
jgi:hypothetical protein